MKDSDGKKIERTMRGKDGCGKSERRRTHLTPENAPAYLRKSALAALLAAAVFWLCVGATLQGYAPNVPWQLAALFQLPASAAVFWAVYGNARNDVKKALQDG